MDEKKIKELNALVPSIAEEILDSGMNADELKRFGKYLAPTKAIPKAEYAKSLAWALCTPSKFLEYYNNFDKNGKEIIHDLVFSSAILTKTAIYRAYQKFDYSKYRDDSSKLPFPFILNYDYTHIITLPSAIKKCIRLQLSEILPQKNKISDEDFKNTVGYFSSEDGLTFFSNIQHVIQFLIDAKFFERRLEDAILKGTIQKVAKIADFKPFSQGQDFSLAAYEPIFREALDLPITSVERTKYARLSLAIGFLSLSVSCYLTGKNKKSELLSLFSDPKTLYRNLLANFFGAQTTKIDEKCLYPNISLHAGYYYKNPDLYRAMSMGNFIELIKKTPPKTPTKFSAYLSVLEEKGLPDFFDYKEIAATTIFFYGSTYYSGELYMNKTRDYLKTKAHYNYLVKENGYTNLFLMLASIGLFEITWELPCKTPENTCDIIDWNNDLNRFRNGRIGYIKITPLGEYAFGISDTFESDGLKQFSPPRLDENTLIIHIDEGDKSSQIFLEPFCVPLSRTLYKADELRLKKFCKTKDDVDSIFKTLTYRAKVEIPKIWSDLKNSILDSFVTLRGESDWIVISLEGQSPELIRCIERLSRQGLCLKMEGRRVAVHEKKISLLKKRIEAEGFKIN